MQLLLQIDTPDYDGWKSAFDADAADRMLVGLTLLQLWRSADHGTTTFALFSVNDRARAQTWLDKETGFGAAITAHFLRTA
jgi:hypothetical protein